MIRAIRLTLTRHCKNIYTKILVTAGLMITTTLSYADGVIPISSDDQTSSNSNFATTVVTILKKDILPLVELGGATILLFVALAGLWKGYKEYQRERDMDPLKHAILSSVILIVVGGAILFLIDKLRTYNFA